MKNKDKELVQHIKKNTAQLAAFVSVFLVLLLAIFIGLYYILNTPSEYFDPHEPHDITALCLLEKTNELTVERTTTLNFEKTYSTVASQMDAGYTTNESIQITDSYILTNDSETALSLSVFYPITHFYESDEFGMWVNQVRCNNRWGAYSQVEYDKDVSNNKVQTHLADGTYFFCAFPDWPHLGIPNGKPEASSDSDVLTWNYKIVFYLERITIPAGKSATIQVVYPADYASELRFSPIYGSIPCNNHTLIIENAEHIEILQQNLGLSTSVVNYKIDLDPKRTDYSFSFTVKPPDTKFQ